MSTNGVDRRRFLAAAGGSAALLATFGEAADAATVAGSAGQGRGTAFVLHDARLPLPADVLARLTAAGTRIITLSGDPVRFWRSADADPLRERSARLYGLTRWADFLIFRGLAAETRRHVRYERLEPASDAFTWLID